MNNIKIGDKFKCKYKGEVKHGIIKDGPDKGHAFLLYVYDVTIANNTNLGLAIPVLWQENIQPLLDKNHITDFEILQEDYIQFSNFVDGVYFTCMHNDCMRSGNMRFKKETNEWILELHKQGDLDEHFIYASLLLPSLDLFLKGCHVDNLKIFTASHILETSVNSITNNPILCALPKNHIVSLVFNNNKGVINTVDVVSATCEHEAIGAAIEKQMKIHSGLIVYTVVPYELEEEK